MNGLPVVFANPWGALALLGIPAVILIHCLQQKSRQVKVSTLFLLERLGPDSKEGRQLTWLRSSLAFWLQILCVLIVAWLLVEPRWLRVDAVQRVSLVLDSSISMRAFSDDLVERVSPRLNALASLAPRTYWTLSETDPTRPVLYEGFDLNELEKKMRDWKPSMPAHDYSRPLELARSLAGSQAVVVFITDRMHEVPSGVDTLAIGEPIENCGLLGLRLVGTGDDLEWQVLVQNYGQKTAHRSWWIELDGQKTEKQMLDLEPGHSKILKGKFPPGLDKLEVCLDPDRFTLDDRMAIVRPQPKRLTVDLRGDDATTDLFIRLTQTLPGLAVAPAGQPADLAFISMSPQVLIPDDTHSAIVLFNNPLSHDALEGEPFVAETDPLNEDLNWQGLIIQPNAPLKPGPQDRVLLWKDHDPVIYIRSLAEGRRQLVFNFNFPSSNASRLPAFVLLINRFLESIRMEKKIPEVRDVELTELLTIAASPSGGPVVLHDAEGTTKSTPASGLINLRAPSLPGMFSITQDGETLLSGAADFADARESDFSSATTKDTLADHRSKLINQHTRSEAMTPLWIILVGILLMTYWAVTRPRRA